ncbi:MAG: type IVB secretion system apparatus protein IcmL/DotI [Legionellales bacterium]|nr:type IVB secretion system apparatus protein IcmL/DotI [Legionellales bacterium]
MDDKAVELLHHRNNFYRDNYKRVLFALLILVITNIILALGAVHVIKNPPAPKYFATNDDGRLTLMHPLSAPVMSTSSLTEWATRSATTAYTFDFVNYRKSLQEASGLFTASGWQSFEKALVASNNLKLVLTKKLVTTAVAQGAPVVLKRGVLNGAYSWQVQLPVLVTYQSASMNVKQPMLVTMLIRRVDVSNNPAGIAIAQFIASSQSTKVGP